MDGFSNKNGDIMGIHGIPLGYRTTQNYKFEIWVCHVSEIGLYPQMASKASTNGIFSHSLLDHQMVNLWLAKMVSGSHSGTKKTRDSQVLIHWQSTAHAPPGTDSSRSRAAWRFSRPGWKKSNDLGREIGFRPRGKFKDFTSQNGYLRWFNHQKIWIIVHGLTCFY